MLRHRQVSEIGDILNGDGESTAAFYRRYRGMIRL
jgi:hypothetical protein